MLILQCHIKLETAGNFVFIIGKIGGVSFELVVDLIFYAGWDDIGYSFLIGGDGRVYVGRGWNGKGAHTRGYNHRALGIAFMGDFTWIAPDEDMLNAARKLIECGIQLVITYFMFRRRKWL